MKVVSAELITSRKWKGCFTFKEVLGSGEASISCTRSDWAQQPLLPEITKFKKSHYLLISYSLSQYFKIC